MADDRPANDDLAAVVAELRRDLADLKSTALARASRLPTGSIEPTILPAPKADTLFLQGQTLNRTDYPVLWQWILDNNLNPSVFGNGNGSTTFALPDYRGRTMTGSTTARPVGTLYGDATRVITPANMARHTHQVSIRDHMSTSGQTAAEVGSNNVYHTHSGNTGQSGGNHGNHNNAAWNLGPGNLVLMTNANSANNNISHYHPFGTGNDNSSHQHYLYIPPHSVNEVAVGDNAPFNIESPAFSGNWLIWT